MTETPPPSPALLPSGLRDLLPPEAETEAASVEQLMAVFATHGYERVKPPLLEFEDTLLSGSGSAVADQAFRLMDPDSHRMMALRPDTTPQVARIATTRLAGAPRPLRLSYAGQCVRVRAGQLAPDRQIPQAGIELIGADTQYADAELLLVGAEGLASVGIARVSFDLTLPPLVPAILAGADLKEADRAALLHALDRKDAAAVRDHGGAVAGTLNELLLAAGPVEGALAALAHARLPEAARVLAERLAATVAAIRARAGEFNLPELKLTIDPIEFRGFRYHTGVCMTAYAPGRQEELGSGGRYRCGGPDGDSEPAAGLTLNPDAVLRAAPPRARKVRVFVPVGADRARAATLRREGYVTIAPLEAVDDPVSEARRQGCAHILKDGALHAVGETAE